MTERPASAPHGAEEYPSVRRQTVQDTLMGVVFMTLLVDPYDPIR